MTEPPDDATAVGRGADETVIVPPPIQPAPEFAWSVEDQAQGIQRQSWRVTWGRAAALLSIGAAVAIVLGVAGWALSRMRDDAAPSQPTPRPPTTWAAPAPPPWMPNTPTEAPPPPATPAPQNVRNSLPGTDDRGWVAYRGARCESGDRPAVLGRTAQSVVVVCQIQPGNFYYRGVRLSDGASIELANAVRSSDGFDVINPTDGTHYRIRPASLTIASPGGPSDFEPMLEYASD